MKSYSLPSQHYAASWPLNDESILTTGDLTELGQQYARADGAVKKDLLLQICQAFHGYLMKYLVMICRVPIHKGINSDSAKFLAYFRTKGKTMDMESARAIARSLHLAFKGMESAEVYDVLMGLFLDAAAKYEPDYAGKVKLAVEAINHELSKSKQIRVVDVNRHLEFDSDRHLRFLSRRGFLQAVKGKDSRICGWTRPGLWPPPAKFFESGPVGFAYYVQTWFRYYLQQWIENRRSELEAKDGVYSFDFHAGFTPNGYRLRAGNEDGTFIRAGSEEVVASHGSHDRPA
jgi:hypothetical protein